jgi:hypothetical protein
VRGTLREFGGRGCPSPQPSQRELLLARPRKNGEREHTERVATIQPKLMIR